MTTTTVTYTPWGWTRMTLWSLPRESGESGHRAHAGLKLSRERWDSLPADSSRDAMLHSRPSPRRTARSPSSGRSWASPTTTTGRWRSRSRATSTATLPRCLPPPLPAGPPLPRHRLLGRPGLRIPFERFDTRVEAESFVGDAELIRANGRMEAVECTGTLPLCLEAGRQAMTATTRPQAPQPAQHDDEASNRVWEPVRHSLDGRGRRALRGLRLPRQGRLVPARRHRACLPADLPAPAARDTAGRDHRPDARHSMRCSPSSTQMPRRQKRRSSRTRRRDRAHPQGAHEGQGGARG